MPLLVSAFPYLSATAFLAALSPLGWRLIAAVSVGRRRPLAVTAYAFLLIAASVLCLATFRLASGWLYSLFGFMVAEAILASTGVPAAARPHKRRALWISAIIILAPPIALAGRAGYRETVLSSQTHETAGRLESAMLASATSAKSQVAEVAALPAITSLDVSAAGLISLRQEAVSRALDFILLTDSEGHVLLRSDETAATGETLTDRLPWSGKTLVGEAVNGLSWDQNGQLIAVAASPIMKGTAQIGMVMAGFSIDSQYLRHRVAPSSSAILLDGQRTAASATATPLDASVASNTGFVGKAASQPDGSVFAPELSGARAVASTTLLPTLDSSRPARLIVLGDE